MYLTTPGLVLRVCPYNENDAMLTILTQKVGRISAKVRGLRRKNSPLSAPCQLLAFSDFTLFAYKDSYTINEASTIELFAPLRKDLQKLSLGTYFAQVVETVSQEDAPDSELLSLTLNCLYVLCGSKVPENQAKAVFELRLACLAGYMPDLNGCCQCGSEAPDCFDISEGRLECSTCRTSLSKGIRMPVNSSVLDAMRYICICEPKKLFSFTLPPDSMQLLSDITEAYFLAQLERGFPTLDFYKSLLYQPH